jgi:hypothetical protein
MALYQNQLQEDFLSDFDATLSRKEEFTRKEIPLSLEEDANASKDSKPAKEDLQDLHVTSFDDDELDLLDEPCGLSISYLYDNINVVTDNARYFFQSLAEEARTRDFVNMIEGCVQFAENCVCNIPKYEEELKFVTAGCLFFCGGGWTVLASLTAAAELFDTRKEILAAYEVGEKFMSVDDLDDEDDVTPAQLTQSFKTVGMQFAQMLAVLHCEAWAEICISFAFASKLNNMVNFEGFCDEETRKHFSAVDAEWLSLLSAITSAIVALIIFGIWPGLVIGMYMGYVGLQFLNTVEYRFWLPAGSSASHPEMAYITCQEFLEDRSNQLVIGLSVTLSALFQGYYSYSAFQFVSWLMFLQPAVQLFNIVSKYFSVDIKSLKLE